ncbi:hypothetical protein JAAARDRAFT_63623 [Jaapia argillacea MUCL 33604]|uniref:Uncharacterized protein n=1 Tax=Jaapia argillacea MUCL 33604 TaxID=933084 RepID=A0A067PGJ9_9AGAM|nr:hypothetical protein JAAARDRAFT_63623 [Jaapia argillacea MUCL 33604]
MKQIGESFDLLWVISLQGVLSVVFIWLMDGYEPVILLESASNYRNLTRMRADPLQITVDVREAKVTSKSKDLNSPMVSD